MNRFTRYIPLIALAVSLLSVSCEKVIDVELRETNPTLVVEGIITDQLQPYSVRLTRTKDYFDPAPVPRVDNAQVWVTDNMGTTDTLYYVSDGMYYTSGPRQGVVGRSYTLTINVSGKTYQAQTQIMKMNTIDSLTARYEAVGSIFQDPGYYINIHEKEDPDPGNYYLWKLYRNDTLMDDPVRYLYQDDKLLDTAYVHAEFPYQYNLSDSAKVEQYSLTRNQYDYYTALDAQLNRGGGPF